MATTVRDGAPGKQPSSSSSSPQNIDVLHGRKTPKSSISGSPDSVNSSLLEKPIPRYLQPTVRTCHHICKYGKKEGIEDATAKRLIWRRSFDKPPTPSHLQKSRSIKERTLKPSSSFPRNSISPKTLLERKPRGPRNGNGQPLSKSKSFKMGSSDAKSRATTITTTINTTTTSPEITEDLVIKSEQEEKQSPTVTGGEEEHTVLEVHPIQDQEPMNDSMHSEAEISENKESEDCNSLSTTLEELDAATTVEAEEEQKDKNGEVEGHKDEYNGNKEDDDREDVSTEHFEGSLGTESNEGGVHGEKLKIGKEKADSTDPSKKENPTNLKFQQGKELGEDEDGEESQRRLNFKERTDIEVIGDEEAESENVVLKHQDGQGKKEVPALNNVTEETASKLVEERKSKVKALVGAFETVISLQECGSQSQSQSLSPSPSESTITQT